MSSMNLSHFALLNGGCLLPLIVPSTLSNGTGTFNPSIFDDNGQLWVCLRHCQVTLYHAEKNIFEHKYGPLVYLNPENDITLTSRVFMFKVNDDLSYQDPVEVNMALDVPPIWEFVGLEDSRLVKWDNTFYLCGVRRDTTTNGQGRIEMSSIEMSDDPLTITETSRFRIPAPGDDSSYCEKNWMPVNDLPYHFVKWSNPTEVVKADPINKTCETVFLAEQTVAAEYDYRGGSNIVTIGDYYVAIAHTVNLYQSEAGRKNARYRHVFIVWDKEWNVVKYSIPFSFMDGEIEFCAGLAVRGDDLLVTFGFQDNAAYILKLPKTCFEAIINA